MEDEMTCSVCQELFKDPVTLRCGHNFCQECVCEYWKGKTSQSCPICRDDSATSDLKTNHTLRNIVDIYKKEGKKVKGESKPVCSQHKKELELYCVEDQEAICVMCVILKKHKNHEFLSIEEALQKFKEELKNSLKPLQDTHQKIAELKERYRENLNNIHGQVYDGVYNTNFKVYNTNFTSLFHQCVSATPRKDSSLLVQTLRDMRERIKEYADYKPREPEAVSAVDIDRYKYTDCLQYRVWKKMLKFIYPVMVTLDPNTAHPNLTVSEDLTAVTRGSTRREDLPDNPERFDRSPCVLGSEGFTSGRHSWVVDVEKQTNWILGVAAESANRKEFIFQNLKPERGFWTVRLYEGGYIAFTDEGETRLDMLKTPKKVLVFVDYEAGKVSFSNADDMSHIYTFTHKFKHKIFPFFWPGTEGASLRICNL
nr:PREDICTED: E3 ubiquitin-protein ligase TRIM39-like [Latimeria chalumnae]|eukprot:XP_014353424.1 PREDICTED: E3 ubiquitin-protein ligase TRIM39-like [Latimeria chalumnae]